MYGHVHMAKTGGTSLNGMLANKFERVCGHKGYSYDAYQANEKAKIEADRRNTTNIDLKFNPGSDRVMYGRINEIGFEDCDYVSNEQRWNFFTDNFKNSTFHGIPMELHVPCRDPIEHLISTCNHFNKIINCTTDETFFRTLKECELALNRYSHNFKKHFTVKCFDFKKQFTSYIDYMSTRLQPRRLVSEPYIQRDPNKPRNKTNECIWSHPDLIEKARSYLLERHDYYQFCDSCMGTEDDITK